MLSDAQRRAIKRWKEKNIRRIPLDVRTTEYDAIHAFCEREGVPVNTFIRDAIRIGIEGKNEVLLTILGRELYDRLNAVLRAENRDLAGFIRDTVSRYVDDRS